MIIKLEIKFTYNIYYTHFNIHNYSFNAKEKLS